MSVEVGSLYEKTKYKPIDIQKENKRIVELIRKRYFNDGYKIVRFSNDQKEHAQRMFKVFSKLLIKLEKAIMEKYRIEFENYPEQMYLYDEYSVITFAKDCLRDNNSSMFACLNCGDVSSVNGDRIKRMRTDKNVNVFHICKAEDDFQDPEYGEGIRTNWLKIRALFVENNVFKYLLKLVSKELLGKSNIEGEKND